MSPGSKPSKQIAHSEGRSCNESQIGTSWQGPHRKATYHRCSRWWPCCPQLAPCMTGHSLKLPPSTPAWHTSPDNVPFRATRPRNCEQCLPSTFQIKNLFCSVSLMFTDSRWWPAASHSPHHRPPACLTRRRMRKRPPASQCSAQPMYSDAPRVTGSGCNGGGISGGAAWQSSAMGLCLMTSMLKLFHASGAILRG